MRFLSFVKARLAERSTWTMIGAGVTGAAALASPWSFVFAGTALVAAMVPTGGTGE